MFKLVKIWHYIGDINLFISANSTLATQNKLKSYSCGHAVGDNGPWKKIIKLSFLCAFLKKLQTSAHCVLICENMENNYSDL